MTDRFDKFTERARKTLQFAQEEAQHLNRHTIGIEHILLGLLSDQIGVGGLVLAEQGIDLEAARAAVKATYGMGNETVRGPMDLDPKAKLSIEKGVAEARDLRHHYIGTEHLLLGMLDVGDDKFATLLESLGATGENLRKKVLSMVKVEKAKPGLAERMKGTLRSPTSAKRAPNFKSFTERARMTMRLAHEEAQLFNHNFIGTEHILLGLVRQDDSVAGRVLNDLGIELDKVRTALEFIIERGDRMVMGEIGLTPRAKHVVELAVDEAHRLGHDYIGTEHLLLGLVREGEGIAAGVLESLGVSLEKVRAQVIEGLKPSSGYTAESKPGKPIEVATTAARQTPDSQRTAITMLRTLFDYSIWARDQLLPLIEGLEDEERKKGDNKGVYGSIHDTLAHMAQSEWLWIQRCLGDSPLRLPKGEDFPTLTSLINWWNDIHAQAILYLNSITEADLQTELTYLAPDGKRRTRKVWHMLVQVPNHQTEHRSQVATMLGSIGLEVPPTDMVVYLNELK